MGVSGSGRRGKPAGIGNAPPGSWKGKRAVVTGANGFLGTRLSARLESLGAKVTRLDRECDVRDSKSLLPHLKEGDAIFHLAGLANPQYCHQHPDEAIDVNAFGTLGVLRAAQERKCGRVILASTAHVYGAPKRLPIRETHPLNPVSPYGTSKMFAEKFCSFFSRRMNFPTVILRFFNIYGPGQKGDYLIPTIIGQLGGKQVALKDFNSRRDYVYVDDAIRAFVLAGISGKAPGEAFNIGSGKSTSAKEIADLLVNLSGRKIPVVKAPSKSFVVGTKDLYADISKAKSVLGWKPKASLEEGLRLALG